MSKTKKKVIVFGGGVAGMTAAHELGQRGYDVTIYERRKKEIPGGKARTEPFVGSGTDGRKDLPGEHGFRFFPGFYKNVTDTMRRTPFPGNQHGVYDKLVPTELSVFAPLGKEYSPEFGGSWFYTLVKFPASLDDLSVLLDAPPHLKEIGLTDEDFSFFGERIIQFLTSCEKRRRQEYSRISWWDYTDAAKRSKAYQLYLATGMTRNAVATQAHLANTYTIGTVAMQLMMDMATPGDSADRVLIGPTNDVWLNPWLKYLRESFDVKYKFDAEVDSILFDESSGKVTGIVVTEGDTTSTLEADYYICAVPVEVATQLINKEMKDYDPVLTGLDELSTQVNWMNGILYYLTEDITIVKGHINAIGTPWAITAISELPFWSRFPAADYGDGTIRTVFSVDISDWNTPGMPGGPAQGKTAMECTPDEIAEETWYQLKASLNTKGHENTLPETYASYWLDDDIQISSTHHLVNLEPLLVNEINSWHLRPDAYTAIHNFFIAGDYVRTSTNFASMEGANESARRAVNSLLERDHYRGMDGPCSVFKLSEPLWLAPLKEWDRERFDRGLPWAPAPEIADEFVQVVKKEIHDVVEKGIDIIHNLNPINIIGRAESAVAHFFGTTTTLEDKANAVLTRNSGREGVLIPKRPWATYQQWRKCGFLHSRTKPEWIRHLVPEPLEIDTWDGWARVTLVPMYMEDIEIKDIGGIPGNEHFPELNVRTYVTYKGLPGVFFFKIYAPPYLADFAARAVFDLPYEHATMTIEQNKDTKQTLFTSHRKTWTKHADFGARYQPHGKPFESSTNPEVDFLVERYCSYALNKFGHLVRSDIVHDSWKVYEASATELYNNIWQELGIRVADDEPYKVFYSDGVDVVLWTMIDADKENNLY